MFRRQLNRPREFLSPGLAGRSGEPGAQLAFDPPVQFDQGEGEEEEEEEEVEQEGGSWGFKGFVDANPRQSWPRRNADNIKEAILAAAAGSEIALETLVILEYGGLCFE